MIAYKKLCICTGATPRSLLSSSHEPMKHAQVVPPPSHREFRSDTDNSAYGAYSHLDYIYTLRDSDSVCHLVNTVQSRSSTGRITSVLIVGNGGIALELVHMVRDCTWRHCL
mgnify:CR=1 FL=1